MRSARTLDIDLLESLTQSRWGKESSINNGKQNSESHLLMLTYWILRAQDFTKQKLSKSMVQSLKLIFDPISRWMDSPHQRIILEIIEMWFRLSNHAEYVISKEVLDFILQMLDVGFEPKLCMNILVDYCWNADIISINTPLISCKFIALLLKYAIMSIDTCDDPLEISLFSVEILVSLMDHHSNDLINLIGMFLSC